MQPRFQGLGDEFFVEATGEDGIERIVVVGSSRKVPMSESITIPAHIENGSLHLDAPLPPDVERVEVLAHLKARAGAPTGLDLIAFLDALPAGKRTKAELDARLDAERNSWPD